MKRLLIILFFLPLLAHSQARYKVSPGEYTLIITDSVTGISYFVNGNASVVSGTPANAKDGAAGAHGTCVFTTTGDVYCQGDNSAGQMGVGDTATHSGYVKITVDSLGNPFTGVVELRAGGTEYGNNWNYIARKSDGTVWVWGETEGGYEGNGTNGCRATMRPVQVTLPKAAKKVQAGAWATALLIDGTEYRWGDNYGFFAQYVLDQGTASPTYMVPTIVHFGSETDSVTDIAEGNGWSFSLHQNGHLYAGAYYGPFEMIGGPNLPYSSGTPSTINTERRVDTAMTAAVGSRVLKNVFANSIGTYFWFTDGSVWYAGDNICGGAGNGQHINWLTYTGVNGFAPENWDQSFGEDFFRKPVQLAPGKVFTAVFVTGALNYCVWLEDAQGNLYATGRGKSGVLGDGISEVNGTGATALYPNSYDRVWITLVHPFRTTLHNMYPRYCVLNPTATDCSSLGMGSHTANTVNFHASVVGSSIVLTSAGSTASTPTFAATITQVSGPASADMGVQSSDTSLVVDTVTTAAGAALPNGKYVFQAQLVNTYGDTASAMDSVTLPSGAQSDYYFAAAGSGTACDSLTPCAPSYINTVYASAQPGYTLHLKRGDQFNVQIIANASGSAGSPITMRPYGTGNQPVICGMTPLTGWTSIGTNLWQATPSGPQPVLLTINDTLQSKSTSAGSVGQYWTYTPINTTSMTDAVHAGSLSVGDTLVIMSSAFTYNKVVITGIAGSTITFSPAVSYTGIGGTGYFKQSGTPSVQGQWRNSGGTVQLYSLTSPTSVKIPSADTALISEGTYQEYDSIRFSGVNNAGVILAFQVASHNVFYADTIDYALDGAQLRGEGYVSFLHCKFLHNADMAIQRQGTNNYNNQVLYDTAIDIGMLPGMGGFGNLYHYYSGMEVGDSGCVVKFCYLDQIGYCGVINYGSSAKSDSSAVGDFGQILEDGAAFYGWAVGTFTPGVQPEIVGNVIWNGGSAISHNGVSTDFSSAVCGIYRDNFEGSTLISGNSIYNVNSNGIFVHSPNNTITGNKVYKSGFRDLYLAEKTGSAVISGTVISHNTFGSATPSQPAVGFYTDNSDIGTMASGMDSNTVIGTAGTVNPYWTYQNGTGDHGTSRTPAGWNSNTGQDAHSTFQTGIPLFLYNASASAASYSLGQNKYQTPAGAVLSGTASVPAYQSTMLLVWHVGFNTKRKVGRFFYN